MVLRGNQMSRTYKAMGTLAAVVAVLVADGRVRADTRAAGDDVFVPAAPQLVVIAVETPDRSALREEIPAIRVPDLRPDGISSGGERAHVTVPARPTLSVTPAAPDLTVLDEGLPPIRVPSLRPQHR